MFMLKSKHEKIVADLQKDVIYYLDRVSELKAEITQDNAKIVELGNALNDEKKNSSKLRGLIEVQDKSLIVLNERLINAVEGLSDKDKRILRAKVEGNYIYTVIMADKTRNIDVPISTKDYSDFAKHKFLRHFNLSNQIIGFCKAERWVI